MAVTTLHLTGATTDALYDELSRLYARDCLSTLAGLPGYAHHVVHVAPDGTWRFPAGTDLTDAGLAAATPLSAAEAIGRIAELAPDLAVPQMFCPAGMTSLRALLEVLGIPYLGNRPLTMALGADKALAKAVVAAAGVVVAPGEVVGVGDVPVTAPPAVVKPVDGDNSLGMTQVHERGAYPAAVAAACAHGSRALVESYVALGREVRCAVLERDGELVALPLEEYAVDEATKPVRDAADKLAGAGGDTGLSLVAKTTDRAWIVDADDPVCEPVWAAARRCHRALGCRHYSLIDFRVDPAGRPVFLEASLYCSFARQSVVATMARAAGIDTPDLFATVAAQALHPPSPSERRPS